MWEFFAGPAGGKCGGKWVHESGWMVRHCGHPTALWPYFLQHPELHDGCEVVSFNGLGFKRAATSRFVVEWIVSGHVTVTDANCVPRIRRVLVTTFGEIITED